MGNLPLTTHRLSPTLSDYSYTLPRLRLHYSLTHNALKFYRSIMYTPTQRMKTAAIKAFRFFTEPIYDLEKCQRHHSKFTRAVHTGEMSSFLRSQWKVVACFTACLLLINQAPAFTHSTCSDHRRLTKDKKVKSQTSLHDLSRGASQHSRF